MREERVTHALAETVFDRAYEGTPSWEISRPQPCVERLIAGGLVHGRVLDVGCGTGLNALCLASAGHVVVGIDIAFRAVELARARAEVASAERPSSAGTVRFLVTDALEFRKLDAAFDKHSEIAADRKLDSAARSALGRGFDTALDVGLFHSLQPGMRAAYAASLARVVRHGGVLFLFAWSDRNPFGYGPERVTRTSIRRAFRSSWRVERMDAESLDSRLRAEPVHAWRATIRRT